MLAANAALAQSSRVVVGYVTTTTKVMPDPSLVTHLNYAFAWVNDTYDGVKLTHVDRMQQILNLRKKNPDLKVLLSIGGWGAGGFSEMASTETRRKKFAADCNRVMRRYRLDGIDIDWEYPGSNSAKITCSPQDKANFSLLMRDIREAIGSSALLTLATAASAQFYDFAGFIDYVDFVNVMSYDMQKAPLHHAALRNSSRMGSGMSCEKAVAAHLAAGVPASKLVLGVPFYGRGCGSMDGYRNYNAIIKAEGYTQKWDRKAKVPYLVDAKGNVVMCFDNARSLQAKCQYVKDNGLRGVMYWDCSGDDEQFTLARTVWEGTR